MAGTRGSMSDAICFLLSLSFACSLARLFALFSSHVAAEEPGSCAYVGRQAYAFLSGMARAAGGLSGGRVDGPCYLHAYRHTYVTYIHIDIHVVVVGSAHSLSCRTKSFRSPPPAAAWIDPLFSSHACVGEGCARG